METPSPSILSSHGKHYVDLSNLLCRSYGFLYRDSQSPELADNERSPSPPNTKQVIQANSKSPILLSPLDMITAKLIPRFLFLGNNSGPSRSGKSASLTICPPHRAPRTTAQIVSATARVQRKRVTKYRKTQRHSPVPMQAGYTTQEEQSATEWPQRGLATRPKPKASRKPKGEAVDVNKLHGEGLPLRPKLESEEP